MALPVLQGQALLLAVTVLSSLGFMLIGYDNGLMGGLGMCFCYLVERINGAQSRDAHSLQSQFPALC